MILLIRTGFRSFSFCLPKVRICLTNPDARSAAIAILCDNTTATIEVANYSNQGIYEEVQSVTNSDAK